MKKNLRYIIAFLLALMMLLSLCACAQTGTAGNSGELDLDYVGEDTDQPEEEKPWYSWFTDAFSFGKRIHRPLRPKASLIVWQISTLRDLRMHRKATRATRQIRPLLLRLTRSLQISQRQIPAARRTTVRKTTRKLKIAILPHLHRIRSRTARRIPSPSPSAVTRR